LYWRLVRTLAKILIIFFSFSFIVDTVVIPILTCSWLNNPPPVCKVNLVRDCFPYCNESTENNFKL
jgi:hypothetical protein